MPRPRLRRRVRFSPQVDHFKPRGVPISKLEIARLSLEEVEALRLKNIENLSQIECAREMNTSQSTFQRIINSAYKKISKAIIEGKAIEIERLENK